MEIDLNPDAPHSPDRTRELAAVAAETIRVLNYATAPGKGGLTYPGDAYELLGALGVLTERLPQLCGQISDYLDRAQRAGELEEGPDGPYRGYIEIAVEVTRETLLQAGGEASVLTNTLKAAQASISGVRYVGADDDDSDSDEYPWVTRAPEDELSDGEW